MEKCAVVRRAPWCLGNFRDARAALARTVSAGHLQSGTPLARSPLDRHLVGSMPPRRRREPDDEPDEPSPAEPEPDEEEGEDELELEPSLPAWLIGNRR
jgi:hypothetical protein